MDFGSGFPKRMLEAYVDCCSKTTVLFNERQTKAMNGSTISTNGRESPMFGITLKKPQMMLQL